MKILKIWFLITLSFFITHCSESSQQAISEVKKPKIFQPQIDALNKAKQLNQKVLDSSNRKRLQIERESN